MLEQLAIDYGAERRRLRVIKMRGISFRGGFHDFTIGKGGLEIYPRLVAAEHHKTSSGNSAQRERRTRHSAGRRPGARHERVADRRSRRRQILARADLRHRGGCARRADRRFRVRRRSRHDEARARALGLPLQAAIDAGLIEVQQIDPAEMSPGEFAHWSAERGGETARVVVIDSLNGYLNAMPDGRFLILQMHELLSYLEPAWGADDSWSSRSTAWSGPMDTPLDISYLSDAVLMLRYFEVDGTVRRALSVVKKRSGDHEHTIREIKLTSTGLSIGPPLTSFTGILSGTPLYTGVKGPLLPEVGNDGS